MRPLRGFSFQERNDNRFSPIFIRMNAEKGMYEYTYVKLKAICIADMSEHMNENEYVYSVEYYPGKKLRLANGRDHIMARVRG